MSEQSMSPILKTRDAGLLAVFETVLNGAEIPYFIRGAEAASLIPVNATVVVPRAYEEAARALLDQTQKDSSLVEAREE